MSVINRKENKNVEFISYTGGYPNLCIGKLTLKINGEIHTFGYEDAMHRQFWYSGGRCDFETGDTITREWEIDCNKLPEELKPLASEIDEVFNDNVPFGCCGGCI